jgi:hypothetical protein
VGGIGSDTVLIGRRHVVAVWLCQAGEHRPHVHGDGEAQGLQANRPHERVEQGEAVPLSFSLWLLPLKLVHFSGTGVGRTQHCSSDTRLCHACTTSESAAVLLCSALHHMYTALADNTVAVNRLQYCCVAHCITCTQLLPTQHCCSESSACP